MSFSSEEAVVERASKGDMRAFEVLVNTYEKSLYNIAYRLVSNNEDAMDIVQEVFLKTHQALPKFRGDSRFSTWIYRVCVNASLDYIRKNKKVKVYSLDAPVTIADSEVQRQVEDPKDSIEETVENKFLGETALEALSGLEPHYRSILVLCDIQGYSYQEISEILDVSLGTVKSRIHRARNIVRKQLKTEQISLCNVKQAKGGTKDDLP